MHESWRRTALLGTGGMARVYRVQSPSGEVRALKVLSHPEPDLRRRLDREARVLATLEHPGIVGFHGALDLDGSLGLLLECVEGPTLAAWLDGAEPVPLELVDAIAHDVLSAVAHAHAAGVVHRDLKPANVLLRPRPDGFDAVVTDFGLARAIVPLDTLRTATGQVAGTLAYMAPEQARGGRGTARSDVFSLAALLYEVATGQRCFPAADPVELLVRVSEADHTPVGELRPELPPRVVQAIEGALAVDPERRPADAGELLAAWGAVGSVAWPAALRQRAASLYAPRSLPEAHLHVPPVDDTFVGRTSLLESVAAELRTPGVVTLVGPGGVGKTRLGLEVARSVEAAYPGGVWFCDLSGARSLSGWVEAVGRVLGVELPSHPVERLRASLASRGRILLVLDNLEQLVEHAPAVLDAWTSAENVHVLATSREPLGVRGERVVPVDVLEPGDAVAMFAARARQVAPRFEVNDENREAVTELVADLDHLPLALEIVAARVRGEDLGRMRERVGARLTALRHREAGTDRQRTLRAALDWSWDLLRPEERAVLAQLSVFHGGCDVTAAEAVVQLPEAADIGAVLDSLARRSLLRRAGDRFDLLDTVRRYAAEKLATPGSFSGCGPDAVDASGLRHVAHFAAVAPSRPVAVPSPVRLSRSRLADVDNAVAACVRALETADGHLVARALRLVYELQRRVGSFPRVVELAERALAHPGVTGRDRSLVLKIAAESLHQIGDSIGAARWLEEALPGLEGDELEQLSALVQLGPMWIRSGRYERAAEVLSDARTRAERRGDPGLGSLAIGHLGILAQYRGEVDRAEELLVEALELAEQAGDASWCANWEHHLGRLAFFTDRHEDAHTWYQRSLERFAALGDRRRMAATQGDIGTVLSVQGRSEQGREMKERALKGFRDAGDRRGEGIALAGLAGDRYRLGDLAGARVLLDEAIAVHRSVDNLAELGGALHNLGSMYLNYENAEENLLAEGYLREALRIKRTYGESRSIGLTLMDLGNALARTERLDEARQHLLEARDLLLAARAYGPLGYTYSSLGELEAELGHWDQAIAFGRQAVEALRPTGNVNETARVLGNLACAQLDAGHIDDAAATLDEATAVPCDRQGTLGYLQWLRARLADAR